MKKYKEIIAEIKRNKETIAAQENEIINLDMKAEKQNAIRTGTIKEYKAIKAEADKNAEKITALCENIYKLKIINKILQSNVEAAFIAESVPVIMAALKKYEGKRYGEKTKAAIDQEVKKSGIGFYFSGSEYTERMKIYLLEPFRSVEVEIYTGENRIITTENKIQTATAEIPPRSYIENPEERAAEIIKAKRRLEEATAAAHEAESALNAILPRSIENVYNLKHEYISLNV